MGYVTIFDTIIDGIDKKRRRRSKQNLESREKDQSEYYYILWIYLVPGYWVFQTRKVRKGKNGKEIPAGLELQSNTVVYEAADLTVKHTEKAGSLKKLVRD